LVRFSVILLFVFAYHSPECQEKNDSIKIIYKTAGYGYMYHGNKQSFAAVGRILESDSIACDYYQWANTNRTVGNGFLVVGGVSLFIGSLIAVGLANENHEPKRVFAGVWIGLPLMAISIPLHLTAKRNMIRAIGAYNQNLSKTASVKIKAELGMTSTGPGVVVHF
jgi:hypothetical protein